jgi:cytochrome c biogenesis protein
MDSLDIFDMYHSWWFQGLVSLLTINIIICSIDRLQTTGRIIFTKNPTFNIENYRQRKSRQDFSLPTDVAVCSSAFQRLLAKSYGYCRSEPVGQGVAITAEKGRWTRLGVYGVHLSVVVLLVGALVGSLNGFSGFVNIPEGESADTIQLRASGMPLKLPFTIQCNDFEVQFYDTGAPKEFRSKLVLLEKGRAVLQRDIIVNDPIRYQGINIFQASYGKLEDSAATTSLPKVIELTFRSVASGMIYTLKAELNQPLQIPEDLGTFVVNGYEPAAQFKGMTIGPALTGTLTDKQGEPISVVLPIRFTQFDAMRRGKVVIAVANAQGLLKTRYYTGLQVTRDPGVGLVYFGFILMIIGCMVTFFMSHQQIVVEIQPKADSVAVMVSGRANKNKVGMQYGIERLARKLAAMYPAAP